MGEKRMKKKIIGILICMLLIVSTIIPASQIIENDEHNDFNEIESSNYPDDFELMAYSVSIDTWETNYKLEINNDGLTRYCCMYPEDRAQSEWTLLNEFTIPSNSMDEIWNEILDNDFFNLDSLYESPISVLGGGYAKLTITGDGQTNTVKCVNIVVPKFDSIVMKINMITPGDSNLIYNSLTKYESNSRPFKPDKPSGETSGESGSEYEYTTSCIDPEFNKVWYLFDWDDGTDSGWIGPFDSGEEASAKHTWSLRNTYSIKVKAKDECGDVSIWSDPFAVSMSKTKQKDNTFFLRILEWFYLNGFQTGIRSLKSFISNYLIDEKTINSLYQSQSIDEQILWITNPTSSVATATFQNGSFTKVEIEGCNITVKIHIEIFGDGTEEQGGTVSANDIETAIENFWNRKNAGGNWYIRCKEKVKTCVPEEPGCKVTFDAIVKNSEENETLDGGANWSSTSNNRKTRDADGYHQIRIINDSSHRSVVIIWGPPYNANNYPPNDGTDPYLGYDNLVGGIWSSSASAKTVAHETGHLMGLQDRYTDDANGVSQPHQGYETNIMGSVHKCNETANRSDIEDIVNHGGVYCPCVCCPNETDDEEPEVNIETPHDGSSTSSPVNVTGSASDTGGSGIVELDYKFVWAGGYADGYPEYVDPPLDYFTFRLGPIYLEQYIDPGDWITIIINATDGAGNIGEDSVTVTWVEEEEDTTPPVTEKTIGQPQWEGGYTIASFTPIWLEAMDPEPGSGVNYIHYEVWQHGIMMGSEDIPGDYVEMMFGMYGVLYGIAELRWYAVDNANNVESMHYQEHFILY
jgi:hypothetical protein